MGKAEGAFPIHAIIGSNRAPSSRDPINQYRIGS